MHDHHGSRWKISKFIIIILVALLSTIFFSVLVNASNDDLVQYHHDDYSNYPRVIKQALPNFRVKKMDYAACYILDSGASAEVFDTQAKGSLESGIAKYWYPHYLATVIIAIDRDQTNVVIRGWNDMFEAQQEVSLLETPTNMHMLLAAMAYGLEGENYNLSTSIKHLTSLQENNKLRFNQFESPITVAYDYQAAKLIEEGRNLEIIVPKEGTYSYEKGLLSNQVLLFEAGIENLLLEANLRLLNGQANHLVYPSEIAYGPAVLVHNIDHFVSVTQNANRLIERQVLQSKIYMSIDNREHLMFALVFIIIVTIWTVFVMRRSMQRGVSYAAFFTGLILNGWTLVRLIKYQVLGIPILTRYLWYAFYIFQLTLPLVILWMAWAIDKPKNQTLPPKWWRVLAIFIGLLILLVFTNDLHGYVFHLNLSDPDWDINYTYGLGYYTVLFVSMANIFAAFVIMILKSIKSPRRNSFIFPMIIFILFGVYNYQYIMRVPLIYETDVTIVTGIFAMLMFESCIRAGLIPVNTRYIDLFTCSPLKMQILNLQNEVALASASASPLNQNMLDRVLTSSPLPIIHDNNSILFANSIPGGYTIWEEDISKLHRLRSEIQESTQMLMEANALLAEEEKLKRTFSERSAKKQLMEQLEAEISLSIQELSTMIEDLPKAKDYTKETTRIALLLSYIKRRSYLFFQEKETDSISMSVLLDCMNELSDIAQYAQVKVAIINEIQGVIPIRNATLFYDLLYVIIDLVVQTNCPYVIQHFEEDDQTIIMRLLPSETLGLFEIERKLQEAIRLAQGNMTIKDVDDTVGISLSFIKGGAKHD